VLASERRDRIIRAMLPTGSATVTGLANALDVSEMTIRRDLHALAGQQLVEKVHGGALLPRRPVPREPHFAAKRPINAEAKHLVAAYAVGLIGDEMTVALSAGTTTWQVARQLRERHDRHGLTFLTNSLNVAGALEENGWESIVVSGGSYRTPSDALVGPFANQTLRQLNADLLLLGVHGLHPEVGLTTPNIAEAETNRVMVETARRVVVVADSSKLGQVSLVTFARIEDVDQLITDPAADAGTVAALRGAGLDVVVVDPDAVERAGPGGAAARFQDAG
jgi:DeoR/GlpR family transcriptional regulator of sugar metabolism